MNWVPPDMPGFLGGPLGFAHFCVVVRIAPHVQGSPPRGEANPDNNQAQSNYTVLWTVAGSPYSRATLPVMVSNPYPDRPVQVKLAVEQPLAHYRTYVGATSVRLAGGESRQVEVMVECIADEPPFADIVPAKELYGVPNVVTAVAVILDDGSDVPEPIGGATIEVRAARGTGFRELDVSRRNASGRVLLMADGSPATGGEVVLATRPGAMTGEIAYRSAVGADGRFAVSTPDFLTLGGGPVAVDVCFTGSGQFGPCREKLVLS
jgi:hypothetical protein